MSSDSCNHAVGIFGRRLIGVDVWPAFCMEHARAVRFFNNTHDAVEHPGHVSVAAFCAHCGHELADEKHVAAYTTAMCAELDGTATALMNRQEYDHWLREAYARAA